LVELDGGAGEDDDDDGGVNVLFLVLSTGDVVIGYLVSGRPLNPVQWT
jgi:hypothetical protein